MEKPKVETANTTSQEKPQEKKVEAPKEIKEPVKIKEEPAPFTENA